MTGWPRVASALLAAAVLGAAPAAVAADDDPVPSRVLFSFQGNDVFEASGLADTGDVVYTTNDSGDDAVLYGVDPATGRVTSRTTYAGGVDDVEALALGADGTVWAGDIGDNQGRRDEVRVLRVTPGVDGDAPAYPLTYPGGARDAETLLVHPRTGRVLVVSKSVFGGTVYVAPRTLREGRANRLAELARVPGLVTDGSFLPDGRHVVLRTYATASVYTYPGFERLGTVRLPSQRLGESISVSRTGRVLVTSEGLGADVLAVRLPRFADGPSATPSGAAPATRPTSDRPRPQPPRSAWDWAGTALVALAVAGLGYLTLRAARPRGPRRP